MTEQDSTASTASTSTVTAPATLTVEWDGKTIHLPTGVLRDMPHARTLRAGSDWMVSYCHNREGLEADQRCDYITCSECFVNWTPGTVNQGTVNYWHLNQTSAMQAELNELRHKVAHELIEISKVQQVAHDYAVNAEWCSVYEEAMSSLGIEPLRSEDDITVTVTLAMTVRADRRQRIGDVSWMQQSVVKDRITEALADVDFFDYDYEVTASTVTSVSLDLDS